MRHWTDITDDTDLLESVLKTLRKNWSGFYTFMKIGTIGTAAGTTLSNKKREERPETRAEKTSPDEKPKKGNRLPASTRRYRAACSVGAQKCNKVMEKKICRESLIISEFICFYARDNTYIHTYP